MKRNVETTDILVSLRSRQLDILEGLCLPGTELSAHSTPSFFLTQILVLFPQVQSWERTGVRRLATRLHPHIYASGDTVYISTGSYRGDFHSNGRNIKKAPERCFKDKSPSLRSLPSGERQPIAS